MHSCARDSAHDFGLKFSPSVCVALETSLTGEGLHEVLLSTQQTVTIKFYCYPWLVYHDIKSAMHCSLRLAPTMINHLTSITNMDG